ncbi:cell division protein FtsL [Saccharospirillum mangrovi]|uniref:cell division protein FtsL n=1 Tax=Saccharospirillum mangrovi TaxID=2161747 RepID=UPI000D37281F|nr:cell division protein FtsL [Saccharospirillum mangrovi]
MATPWPRRLLTLVLLVLVLVSAFSVVGVTYQSRVRYAQLESMRQQGQSLEEQWGRLLLEESAFSSPARVERLAREQLKMTEPGSDQVRWLGRAQNEQEASR